MLWILIAAAAAFYLLLSILIFFLSGFIAKKMGKNPNKYRLASLALFGIITATTFAWSWFVSPLPSDEYMIEHFQEHSAEYDQLAQGAIAAAAENKDGNRALQKWMVAPRTTELKKFVQARNDWGNESESAWQFGVMTNVGVKDKKNTAYSIEFYLAGATKHSIRESSIIWKSYWYFPEAQPLTNGKSRCPVDSGKQCLGQMNIEVLPSLNVYPLFAGIGGDRERWCGSYMRRLDDHWFLSSSKACL